MHFEKEYTKNKLSYYMKEELLITKEELDVAETELDSMRRELKSSKAEIERINFSRGWEISAKIRDPKNT
jgi:hypothetical protein